MRVKIVAPYELPLRKYVGLRSEEYNVMRRKHPWKRLSYGVHSTDAAINRYKKYEKEHLMSCIKAILEGKLKMDSPRIKEHRPLAPPISFVSRTGKSLSKPRNITNKEYVDSIRRRFKIES